MRLRELTLHHFDDKPLSLWESHVRSIVNPALRALDDLLTPKLVVTLPVPSLAAVANGDVLARLTPGFAGRIKTTSFYVTSPATTGGKAALLSVKVGANVLTGGALVLTSGNCGTKGASISGTTITGGNTFGSSDEITVVASNVTAFGEGSGVIVLSLG